MWRPRLPGLVTLIGVLLAPHATFSQIASNGAIAGEVRDATGAVLPGVTVEAASPALIEKVRTVVTDGQGRYQLVDLRPGNYTVTFTLTGFTTVRREGIDLASGFTAAVNAELRVGSIEETITVSGASPVVDIQNVSTQTNFSREALDALPTFKTYFGLAAMTVGVKSGIQDVGGTQGDSYGYVTIHNSKTNDGYTSWDGMPFNASFYSGGGAVKQYYINQLAVREMVLSTSGMSAETASGGVTVNVVPKDGGNTYNLTTSGLFANGEMQQSNLSDELRARGLATPAEAKKVYDFGAGAGGPLKRDKMWFYTAHRWWGNQTYAPGNYFNLTPNTMFYTPDLSRQAFRDFYQRDHSLRLTWQAAAKHKITLSHSVQKNCACQFGVLGTTSPEASQNYTYFPIYLSQATWTFPVTNRLLFEAGGAYLRNTYAPRRAPEVRPSDISIIELTTNYTYNAAATTNPTAAYSDNDQFGQSNGRFSVSYITGSHVMKVGVFGLSGLETYPNININQDISYQFRNRLPVSLTQYATPIASDQRIKLNMGIYAQDQWTIQQLTLNLGVRFDSLNSYVPSQRRPAGQFVSAFDIAEIEDVPKWKDISPRLGAAYDLFGNGKTALKASLGRYVVTFGTDIARNVNPANAIIGSASRTWNDGNGNYVPDCALTNTAANGECGPLSANGFGTVRISTRFDPEITEGFGVRPYNWQASAGIQHELRPGTSLTAGYFRRWYGNLFAQQNLAVSANDFTPYCVTAPVDPRLPGGGGNQVCGLYDINPGAFGRIDNLVTKASNFGSDTEVFDGVDISINARFGGGKLIQGGFSTGRTVTNACYLGDQPHLSSGFLGTSLLNATLGAAFNTPLGPDFCRAVLPWSAQTQVKASAVYPLPLDVQVAVTYQNLPGVPVAASFVATNAQIAPSLGRNLAACPPTGPCNATVTISSLIPPNTVLEDRLNQVDLRLSKIFRIGRARVQGNFDIYNALNGSAILTLNTRYGPTWLQPTAILGGRLFEFSAQLDF